MLRCSMSLAAHANANANAGAGETDWMAPYKQEGWETKELKNQAQNGEVTTYELGTPNYQILNPEDQPEFITEDQPHYQEWLRRLTGNANASETIDLSVPRASAGRDTGFEEPASGKRPQWEKLRKRSYAEEGEKEGEKKPVEKEEQHEEEVEATPIDKKSLHPKVQIYAGAKPFQKLIANLS